MLRPAFRRLFGGLRFAGPGLGVGSPNSDSNFTPLPPGAGYLQTANTFSRRARSATAYSNLNRMS